MRIVLFDDNPSALLPFTYLRPSWEVNVGGVALKEWIELACPQYEVSEQPGAYQLDSFSAPYLALNGCLLPSSALAVTIDQLIARRRSIRCYAGNELAYAYQGGEGEADTEMLPEGVHLIHAPWDIIKHFEATMRCALAVRQKGLREVRKNVFAGEGVMLSDAVVTRTDHGPIVVGEGTLCGSFVVLEGPLILGKRCLVRDQAVIARSVIGDVCKVGGEIEDSIIDSHSNKQHHGYLGHSVVGSWVNLGAGTTTSDLKHTYGVVRVDRGAGKEETDLQFCGSFIGEGVKTAINTSLMSGSVLGLNAFVFGTVRGFVPSFTSVTAHGGIEMPFEVALKMRERMMARRGIEFNGEARQVLSAIYERTAAERIAHHIKKGALIL